MNRAANGDIRCQICGSSDRKVLRRAAVVRQVVSDVAISEGRSWDDDGWICLSDLQNYQFRYVQSLLESEKGELTELEREVVRALREQEILSKYPDAETQADRTLGERLADRIASFGGSWTFIIIFGVVLIGWMALNSYVLVTRAFDPFPYILLNLLLSTIAALQAPVIMMSQNRQETRDRLRAVQDYKINLKAELEIRQLHQKIDHLLSHQWERLIEIQKIQMELINELRDRK